MSVTTHTHILWSEYLKIYQRTVSAGFEAHDILTITIYHYLLYIIYYSILLLLLLAIDSHYGVEYSQNLSFCLTENYAL